jgi:glycosyltransferase involved in cell wall biosynthesis
MINKGKPLVTVIISAYNHEMFVEQTILSVVNQTYGSENIELIVIDDFSTDGTGTILDELSKKHNFKFIQNEKNKGISKNLNTLIRLANGKYIACCASDDYWGLTKIDEQVSLMETLTDEYAVCHTDAFIVDKNDKILYSHTSGIEYNEVILPKILINNGIVAPSAMYRKEVFSVVGHFDETLPFEDREMWIRISINYKFAHITKKLVYRRQHETNLSRNPNKDLWYFTFSSIFLKYKMYYEKYGLVKDYHYLVFVHLSASDFNKSMNHLLKSGTSIFKKNTFYAIFKLFTPKYILNLGLEDRLKKYFNKW